MLGEYILFNLPLLFFTFQSYGSLLKCRQLIQVIVRYIVFYSWISSSFPRPPAKRAVAIAMINAFGQLGNVAGSYVWHLKDNGFRQSYGIVTAMFGVTIVGAIVIRMMLMKLNKQLDEQEQAWSAEPAFEEKTGNGLGQTPMMQRGFRYLI